MIAGTFNISDLTKDSTGGSTGTPMIFTGTGNVGKEMGTGVIL